MLYSYILPYQYIQSGDFWQKIMTMVWNKAKWIALHGMILRRLLPHHVSTPQFHSMYYQQLHYSQCYYQEPEEDSTFWHAKALLLRNPVPVPESIVISAAEFVDFREIDIDTFLLISLTVMWLGLGNILLYLVGIFNPLLIVQSICSVSSSCCLTSSCALASSMALNLRFFTLQNVVWFLTKEIQNLYYYYLPEAELHRYSLVTNITCISWALKLLGELMRDWS